MAITPTLSSVGIGAGASGLDVGAIIEKLMTAEAAPLDTFDKKTASYQAKLSALGTLSGAVSTFQGSLSALTNSNNFRAVSATPSEIEGVLARPGTAALFGQPSCPPAPRRGVDVDDGRVQPGGDVGEVDRGGRRGPHVRL